MSFSVDIPDIPIGNESIIIQKSMMAWTIRTHSKISFWLFASSWAYVYSSTLFFDKVIGDDITKHPVQNTAAYLSGSLAD